MIFSIIKFLLDINECELKLDNCTWNTNCQNLLGSFYCVCKDGLRIIEGKCEGFIFKQKRTFYLIFKFICIDIDECIEEPNLCENQNGICKNKFGSFECICGEGFILHNKFCYDK